MNGSNNKNGNGWQRGAAWVLGLLLPAFTGLAIGWVTTSNSRLVNHTERIAIIETQLKDTREMLADINQKIDKLLENHRRP